MSRFQASSNRDVNETLSLHFLTSEIDRSHFVNRHVVGRVKPSQSRETYASCGRRRLRRVDEDTCVVIKTGRKDIRPTREGVGLQTEQRSRSANIDRLKTWQLCPLSSECDQWYLMNDLPRASRRRSPFSHASAHADAPCKVSWTHVDSVPTSSCPSPPNSNSVIALLFRMTHE